MRPSTILLTAMLPPPQSISSVAVAAHGGRQFLLPLFFAQIEAANQITIDHNVLVIQLPPGASIVAGQK